MARDEGAMIARWVSHYAAQLGGAQNLLVFDDNSADGSTDDLGCTVHRIPGFDGRDSFRNGRMRLFNGTAQGLLATYDYVIHTDADEFLIADPARYRDLRAFLADRPHDDVLAGMALNVVHVPSIEPPLREGEPVLGQRRFAKLAPGMCKPQIKRVGAPWRAAMHGIGADFRVDPELFMVHLKFADAADLRERADLRAEVARRDGRGETTNWHVSGGEFADRLPGFATPAAVEAAREFDPAGVDLSSLVVGAAEGAMRSKKVSQIVSMAEEPLARIPARLLGIV